MTEGIEPNFHEIFEDRKALRNESKALDREGVVYKKHYEKPIKDLKKQASGFEGKKFIDSGSGVEKVSLKKAKEALKVQKAEYEQGREQRERAILEENLSLDYDSIFASYPEVEPTKKVLTDVSDLKDFRMARTLELLNPQIALAIKRRNESVLQTVREEIDNKNKEINTANPSVLYAAELLNYKEELGKSGHLCITPSTAEDLASIGNAMLTGKPIFLHGPTGTGKTSLARFAAHHFTGKDAEMVYCNPQTKESNVWGKPGLEPVGDKGAMKTVDVLGPLARAIEEGKPVIFDEFTALPKEQMAAIKGVFGYKPGDEVPIVGNGKIKMAPGFQLIFTANLKSDKNPERQDIPPEMTSEFEQNNIEIRYSPVEESYDIMLARLLNRDGSLDMSFYDLNTTLPNLCRAMADIQTSYTSGTSEEVADRASAKDTSGKFHSLKKFVMNQRSVEAILSYWMVEQKLGEQKRSFAEFLDERLKTALTFKEYPREDRILAAKIFASRGFLTTLTAKELDLPEGILDFNVAFAMRQDEAVKELKEHSVDVKHLTLKEVVQIDPFQKRAGILRNRANQLLGDDGGVEGDEGGEKGTTGIDDFIKGVKGQLDGLQTLDSAGLDLQKINAVFQPFLKRVYRSWNIDDALVKSTDTRPIIKDPTTQDYATLKDDNAPTKFGEYTLNKDTQNIDWESVKDKIFIPDLSAFNNKPIHEVMKYVIDNYSKTHRFPGLEYWKFILEKPDNVPTTKKANLKDGNYYFTPGSLVRDSDGGLCVPYAPWAGSGWGRNASWLGNSWASNCRVVLLEI